MEDESAATMNCPMCGVCGDKHAPLCQMDEDRGYLTPTGQPPEEADELSPRGDNVSEDAQPFVSPDVIPPAQQIRLGYMLEFAGEQEITMPDGMLASVPLFIVVDATGQPFGKQGAPGQPNTAVVIAGTPIPTGKRNLRHAIAEAGLPLDIRKLRNGPAR